MSLSFTWPPLQMNGAQMIIDTLKAESRTLYMHIYKGVIISSLYDPDWRP